MPLGAIAFEPVLSRRAAALVVLALGVVACEKNPTWRAPEGDRKKITLHGEKMTLHTGSVGVDDHKSEASYVLIDATNESDEDFNVTLGGSLLNPAGESIGLLQKQSLRVPSKGTRTFALVDDKQKPRPEAHSATIEVTSAVKLDYKELVTISDVHEYPDGNRVVIKGYVNNTVGRIGSVIVFATFYDEAGRPMKRPSTLFRLERNARRGVQFVGPEGSIRSTLSVGDIVY